MILEFVMVFLDRHRPCRSHNSLIAYADDDPDESLSSFFVFVPFQLLSSIPVIVRLSSSYHPVMVWLLSGYHLVIVRLWTSYHPIIVRLSSSYRPVIDWIWSGYGPVMVRL